MIPFETALSAAWGFFARNWRWMLPALAFVGLGLALVLAKADARHWRKVAASEKLAHQLTVSNYRAAAETARRKDAENVIRVQREQAKITEDVTNDYEARLADARRRADALRLPLAASGNSRGPGAAKLPAISDPAGKADGSAAEDGFSVADRLIATEQAIQLSALQDWVRAQLQVEVNDDR